MHCWLGTAERELGLEGIAYERFKRALALEPTDPYVLATAGNGIAAFDDPEAEPALRTAALTAPGVALARFLYGAYLAREGFVEEGQKELEAAAGRWIPTTRRSPTSWAWRAISTAIRTAPPTRWVTPCAWTPRRGGPVRCSGWCFGRRAASRRRPESSPKARTSVPKTSRPSSWRRWRPRSPGRTDSPTRCSSAGRMTGRRGGFGAPPRRRGAGGGRARRGPRLLMDELAPDLLRRRTPGAAVVSRGSPGALAQERRSAARS